MARRRFKTLDMHAVRESVKTNGALNVAISLVEGLQNRRDDGSRELEPRQFSVRALWEGFVGPVGETLQSAQRSMHSRLVRRTHVEAVNSNAFAFVMGNVILEEIMDGYESTPSVVDQLVRSATSTMKLEPIVGYQAFGSMLKVGEGSEYSEDDMTEKSFVNPEPDKVGRIIPVTEEAVMFDQTGQILDRAREIGNAMYNHREQEGIKTLEDASGYGGYYPSTTPGSNGTQTALFRSSAGSSWYNRTINKVSGTNDLDDWTNVNAALTLFNNMTDEKGNPIVVNPTKVLVPFGKMMNAVRIFGSTESRVVTNTSNTTISDNPIRALAPGLVFPLTSPFLTDATDWFIGDPQRQFVERVLMAPGVQELPGVPDRDILVRFRARRKTGFECRDDKYWVWNVGT